MSKRRVLIVEGDVTAAESLKKAFGRAKLKARLAVTGQEAILKSGTTPPALVVITAELPVVDGIEASRYFKHKFAKIYVPIILVGSDAPTLHSGCEKVNVDAVFKTPYDTDTVISLSKDLIEIGESHQKLEILKEKLLDLELAPPKKRKKMGEVEDTTQQLAGQLCALHASVAEKMIDLGWKKAAENHVKRIAALRDNYPALSDLRARLG